jgi:uncharacterized protein YoxC
MGLFTNLGRIVRGGAQTVHEDVKIVSKVVDTAKETAADVVDKAKDVAEDVVEKGKEVFESLPEPVQDVLKEVADEAIEQGKQFVADAVDEAIGALPPAIQGPVAGLVAQFPDIVLGHVNDTVKFHDDIDKALAWFASEAYKAPRTQQYSGFVLDDDISTDKYAVYVDEAAKVVVNAIRGTIPTDVKDLISDIAIVAGKEMYDKQFKAAFAKWDDVLNKYPMPDWKHRMAGHSLGGGITYFLVMTQSRVPNDRVVAFNAGVGSSAKYKNFLEESRNGGPRTSNLHTYKILADPVSILAGLGKLNLTKPQSANPLANHSMSNFL